MRSLDQSGDRPAEQHGPTPLLYFYDPYPLVIVLEGLLHVVSQHLRPHLARKARVIDAEPGHREQEYAHLQRAYRQPWDPHHACAGIAAQPFCPA